MSNEMPAIWVVIVAAGNSRRLRAGQPKQYLPLAGKTLIEHTINAFDRIKLVTGINVVLAEDDEQWQELDIHTEKFLRTTVGGDQRSISVFNGLDALDAREQDWVLVHDAARPCVSEEDIMKLIKAVLEKNIGGILATPVVNTIKQSTDGKSVDSTLQRTELYAALTPQMFRVGELMAALSRSDPTSTTDESSAMEQQGYPSQLIMGSPNNIKVTYKSDLKRAELILADRDA